MDVQGPRRIATSAPESPAAGPEYDSADHSDPLFLRCPQSFLIAGTAAPAPATPNTPPPCQMNHAQRHERPKCGRVAAKPNLSSTWSPVTTDARPPSRGPVPRCKVAPRNSRSMSHDTPHLMGDRAATGFLRAFSPAGLMMPVSMWMTVSGTPNASAASASGVAAPTAKALGRRGNSNQEPGAPPVLISNLPAC